MSNHRINNIKDALRKLRSNGIIRYDADVAKATGFDKSVIANYIQNRAKPSKNFIVKFKEVYGIELEGKQTFELSMDRVTHPTENIILANNLPEFHHLKSKIDSKFLKAIPYFNTNVIIENEMALNFENLENIIPDDYFTIPSEVDADFVIPVFGASMHPEICNGDRVAFKYIKDWSFFHFGMKYLVITDEQRMIKYIRKHPKKDFILLTSCNTAFEDIEMPIKSIRHLLQVRYICKIEM